MDKTLVIFGALLVISLLLGAGMVVTSASNAGFTKESAIRAATDFVNSEATYKFDGMHDTLTLDDQKIELETYPVQEFYMVTAEFTSRQSGYGDRAGMMMADVLTDHKCVIMINQDNKVVSAVMDSQWDMISQKMISGQTSVQSSPMIPY
jgi:hypothetical protein